MKRVIVSVINDLYTDQRVDRACTTLTEEGFDILLVGRERKNSLPLRERSYKMHRMKLLFEKGPLFYMEYNFRLFLFLLFRKADIYYSNDIDTLLANYMASKLKGTDLVYDSHEYFTGVPELRDRPFVQNIWRRLERFLLPKVKKLITVNHSVAELYKKAYDVDMRIVRNMPFTFSPSQLKTKAELGLPENKKIVILQGGGINIDRGVEETVMAMKLLSDAVYVIVGSGDIIGKLKRMVTQEKLGDKVIFVDRLSYTDMMHYTCHADLGLSLDKDNNLNYKYSLPNKLFEYIQAGIPVLASRLQEVEAVIAKYQVGEYIENYDPKHIAERIQYMLDADQSVWRANAKKAAKELCWEKERSQLLSVFKNG